MMQKKYDKIADALYVRIKKGKVFKTKEEDTWLVDYDKSGNILGIEILNYSKQASAFLLKNVYEVCGLTHKNSEMDEKLVNTGDINQLPESQIGVKNFYSSRVKLENLEVDLLKV